MEILKNQALVLNIDKIYINQVGTKCVGESSPVCRLIYVFKTIAAKNIFKMKIN